MTEADRRTFSETFDQLSRCCRAFYGETKATDTKDAALAYWKALVDLPIEAIIESADTLARSERRMPTAAEWRAPAERIALDTLKDGRQARRPTDAERMRILEARHTFWCQVNVSRIGNMRYPQVDVDAIDRLPVLLPPDPHCGGCGDSGWITYQCLGAEERGAHYCGRQTCDEHSYAVRCRCAATNPVLERSRKLANQRRAS